MPNPPTDQSGHKTTPTPRPSRSHVWVCALFTCDGIETWACSSRESAFGELANACRRYWEDARDCEARSLQRPDRAPLPPRPPQDNQAVIDLYFSVMGKALPPESYDIAARPLIDAASEGAHDDSA